jgi:phosphoenolpyruvate carboxykinase (GTP)
MTSPGSASVQMAVMGDQSRSRVLRCSSRNRDRRPIPNAVQTVKRDTIFTNVALRDRMARSGGKAMTTQCRTMRIDWRGKPWDPRVVTRRSSELALHSFAKADVQPIRLSGKPRRRADQRDPFRRAADRKLVPLAYQSFDWQHGTFLGATLASETTAAATGAVGVVRRDPMAMLPFCGYNMGDYWRSLARPWRSGHTKSTEDIPS